jgi:glucokinase
VLLVGDVGGTHARFAIASRQAGTFVIETFKVLEGDAHATFDDALAAYLGSADVQPDAACIAIAGPVRDGQGHLTNRDWAVSEQTLRQRFGMARALVVNDFLAMARSVPELPAAAFETVLAGEPVAGAPVLVAGPGTGFGVATLLPDGDHWRVISGEGGHMAYAPRTAQERELATLLARDHGYVSNELVASGSGLEEVHAAFCEMYGAAYAPMSPHEMRQRADAGEAMYQALIEVRALAVMGAAGDLALANGALGGVVLAGGVTERIVDFLKTPQARARFVSRGPMSAYLEDCPVRVLHAPAAALIGAAAHFAQVRGI